MTDLQPRKIGIIGGGVAGLTAAWLLDGPNQVTLFEKQPRLGGHAHTIEVSVEGELIPVEAGFEFSTGPRHYPYFHRLLDALAVPIRAFNATATVFHTQLNRVFVLPPWRDGRIVASALYARMAPDLVYFYRFLNQASKYLEGEDSSLTIKEFLDELALPATFRTEFIFPYLMGQFDTEPEEFDKRLACDVLPYSVQCKPRGLSSGQAFEVIGGSRRHIDALTRACRARIETGVAIEGITRSCAGYVIQKANGESYECDHLILATDARAAAGLLADVREAQDIRSILGKVDFYHSRIAVHGDHDLMPAKRSHWSVVNVRYDGTHSQITVFKPWRSNVPVFRSWITFDARPPRHIYAEIDFQHPQGNRAYYDARDAVTRAQGRNNLWFAGAYAHGIDSHESAVRSAVAIADRLDPDAPNLHKLKPNII